MVIQRERNHLTTKNKSPFVVKRLNFKTQNPKKLLEQQTVIQLASNPKTQNESIKTKLQLFPITLVLTQDIAKKKQ